jgi:hypothetical protein
MITFIQEAALPKLSQTGLFVKYNEASNITGLLKEDLATAGENIQHPDDLKEIVALMRLNGDAVIKKAIDAWENGKIVVIYNNEGSKVPSALPFIIIGKEGNYKCYVFADKIVSRLNSTNEYINLMAGIEAGYLALCLQANPDKFISNRNLMLIFADLYQFMVLCPLETRMYMKGDNLTKAMMYAITFFYKIIDGDSISVDSINFKRLMKDKVDLGLAKQVVEEVRSLQGVNFMDLIELIKKINPVRYGNMDATYLRDFVSSCGVYVTFALENPAYLFMLMTSSAYKTKLTSFNINKLVGIEAKKCITQMVPIV